MPLGTVRRRSHFKNALFSNGSTINDKMSRLLIFGTLLDFVRRWAPRDADANRAPDSPAPRLFLQPRWRMITDHGPLNLVIGCRVVVRCHSFT